MMDLAVNKESFNDYVNDLQSLIELNAIINNAEFGFRHRTIAMREKIALISDGVEAPVYVSDEVILNELSLCESIENRNMLLRHYRKSFSTENVQLVKWLESQEELYPSTSLYKELLREIYQFRTLGWIDASVDYYIFEEFLKLNRAQKLYIIDTVEFSEDYLSLLLSKETDSWIISRLVKVLAKSSPTLESFQKIESYLFDEDGRVRANTIEALWHISSILGLECQFIHAVAPMYKDHISRVRLTLMRCMYSFSENGLHKILNYQLEDVDCAQNLRAAAYFIKAMEMEDYFAEKFEIKKSCLFNQDIMKSSGSIYLNRKRRPNKATQKPILKGPVKVNFKSPSIFELITCKLNSIFGAA